MTTGVIFVYVEPGKERSTYNDLLDIKGIKDIYHVFGEFDFVIISKVEGLSSLNRIVDTIREIDTVTATRTIVGAELPMNHNAK